MIYTLALSNGFMYVTYTMEFLLGGPYFRVIRATPSPYSLHYRGTIAFLRIMFRFYERMLWCSDQQPVPHSEAPDQIVAAVTCYSLPWSFGDSERLNTPDWRV